MSKFKVKSYKIHVCTDLNLTPLLIQQGFLIKDDRTFTGLQDCQARSKNKIKSHWNAPLTAINVVKFER